MREKTSLNALSGIGGVQTPGLGQPPEQETR